MIKRNDKKKSWMSFALMTLLLFAVVLTGAGCQKSVDPSGYVQAFMDMLTKGEKEKYMEYSKESEEEVTEEFNAFAESVGQGLGAVGASKEVQDRFNEVLKTVFAKSKYEVGEAKEISDGKYEVPVTIEPIEGLFDNYSQMLESRAAEYSKQLAESGENLDQEAIANWIFNTMLDCMEERIDSITYGEPKTITVTVKADKDGYEIEDKEKIGGEIALALINTDYFNQ